MSTNQGVSPTALVAPFEKLRMEDVETVGGKNSSLGEMISQLAETGVRVPGGFATTAHAFREFLKANNLVERINAKLDALNVEDVRALTQAGAEIRNWVIEAPLPADLEKEIRDSYATMMAQSSGEISVAVRSSATAEDLPDASFAGQQESFLNVTGIDDVLEKIKEVFASLYNDRAISYRVHKGFAHADVALSAGVQRMVRSDKAASGVMFTMDTESGFDQVHQLHPEVKHIHRLRQDQAQVQGQLQPPAGKNQRGQGTHGRRGDGFFGEGHEMKGGSWVARF